MNKCWSGLGQTESHQPNSVVSAQGAATFIGASCAAAAFHAGFLSRGLGRKRELEWSWNPLLQRPS
jgi:hypothetical protein